MRQIPTSSFSVKSDSNGSNQQLIFEPVSGMPIITYQLEMIEQHTLSGFIKPLLRQKNNQVQIKFDVTDYISLSEWLKSTTLEEKQLLGCLDDFLKTIKICESYMLSPTSILVNMEYMYIHNRTGRLSVIYLPVESQGYIIQEAQSFINDFLRQLNSSLTKQQVVQKLANLIEKQGLGIEDLRDFIERERTIYHFGESEKQDEPEKRRIPVPEEVKNKVVNEPIYEPVQQRKAPSPIKPIQVIDTKKNQNSKMPGRPHGQSNGQKLKNKKDKTGVEMAFFSIIFQVIVIIGFLVTLPIVHDFKMLIGLLSIMGMLDIFIEIQILKFVKKRNMPISEYDEVDKSKSSLVKGPQKREPKDLPKSQKNEKNNKPAGSSFGFAKKEIVADEMKRSNQASFQSNSSISNAYLGFENNDQSPLEQTCFVYEERIVTEAKQSENREVVQAPIKPFDAIIAANETEYFEDERTVLLDDEKTEFLDLKRAYVTTNIDNQNKRYGIQKEKFLIGRLEDQADLYLESKHVGRKHAEIHRRDTFYYLKDLNSKNKTFVNNLFIEPNAEVMLYDGDLIKIADCQLTFSIEDESCKVKV